jgi:hypothetical protein
MLAGIPRWSSDLGDYGSTKYSPLYQGQRAGSFTVAAITAARTKLPLSLIVADKTHAVEESDFADLGYRPMDHSESGMATTDTFHRWRSWLRGIYGDRQPVWLILDCYSVHRQEELKYYTAELGISLLFIPPGLTDEFQPIDSFLFGVMKGNCRWMY